MPDYAKAVVYKIVAKDFEDQFGDLYIGSTTKPLSKRMAVHRAFARRGCTSKLYQWMRDIGIENVKILHVANVPCDSFQEQRAREDEYIRELQPSLNSQRAYVSREERLQQHREYYAANRESMATRQREYYAENRESIAAQQREYYAENRVEALQYQREYRATHKEEIAAQRREYYAENRESIASYMSEYRCRPEVRARRNEYRRRPEVRARTNELQRLRYARKKAAAAAAENVS